MYSSITWPCEEEKNSDAGFPKRMHFKLLWGKFTESDPTTRINQFLSWIILPAIKYTFIYTFVINILLVLLVARSMYFTTSTVYLKQNVTSSKNNVYKCRCHMAHTKSLLGRKFYVVLSQTWWKGFLLTLYSCFCVQVALGHFLPLLLPSFSSPRWRKEEEEEEEVAIKPWSSSPFPLSFLSPKGKKGKNGFLLPRLHRVFWETFAKVFVCENFGQVFQNTQPSIPQYFKHILCTPSTITSFHMNVISLSKNVKKEVQLFL